jgi:amino-acid N-acetyltransferase
VSVSISPCSGGDDKRFVVDTVIPAALRNICMVDATSLQPVDRTDSRYAESVLSESGLPTADLSDPQLYIYTVDGDPVGVGGIEQYGTVGLLRSVAIEEAARGQGYGTALTDALLDRGRAEGITELFLLTTTAADFFARLGFERTDRAAAPEQIRETTQFSEVCPDTATCMRRELGTGADSGRQQSTTDV